MRMEWDHKTRERISTAFWISNASFIIVMFWGIFGDALHLSLTFGAFQELDSLIFKIWFVITIWTWIISSFFWIVSERVKTRRMDSLKRLIDEMEKSELGKYVKSNTPPYVLADSVDRSLLGAIYEFGEDYLSVSTKLYKSALPGNPDQVNNLLARLYLLGLIDFDWEYEHIVLTVMGIDAVHIPVSLFTTKLPSQIWDEVLKMKRAIQSGDWNSAVVNAARALEAALKDKLEPHLDKPYTKSIIRSKNLDIGKLHDGIRLLRELQVVDGRSLEWHLFEAIRRTRNPQIHLSTKPIEVGIQAASKCDIYLSLLLRSWYSSTSSKEPT